MKKAETDQKYDENLRKPISKMRFFKNAETDQNYEETDLKYWETDTKYLEIPQQLFFALSLG